MPEKTPGRVIYIGSIPYDQTEEQLLDILKSVGPVSDFKLIFDKESGKSKGYGFAEFYDLETAESAFRNLNNYQIGNRKIKVDYTFESSLSANNNKPKSSSKSNSSFMNKPLNNSNSYSNLNANSNSNSNSNYLNSTPNSIPLLPPGLSLAPNTTPANSISSTLESLPIPRIINVIKSIQRRSKINPNLTEELFTLCPQLSYSIVQSLLMLNLIDQQTVGNIVLGNNSQEQIVDVNMNGQGHHQADSSLPVKIEHPTVNEGQAAMLRQVLELSDADIMNLPEDQRNTINELKRKVQSGEIVVKMIR